MSQLPATAPHAYLSTACLHGLHQDCGKGQRTRGDHSAPHCKFCQAVCLCPVCQHAGALARTPGRARAFYRAYPASADRRSRRVTRLHIVREDGRWGGQQGWCGTSARRHVESEPVIVDPMPPSPPEGLSWCPPCIGHLTATAGYINGVAALLAHREAA